LFRFNFYLITTSNTPPNQLYWHGLQRQNFLPTIKRLKECLIVLELDSLKDYRGLFLKKYGLYYIPLNKESHEHMQQAFDCHAVGRVSVENIEICRRPVHVVKRSQACIWFDFKSICGVPRSQADYVALAKEYEVVLVSNVVKMSSRELDLISCFVHMVDVFYDAKIKLIISAEVAWGELYTQGKLLFDYARTQSRLQEMSSEDYFLSDRR
jgi:cell division protein ZapE